MSFKIINERITGEHLNKQYPLIDSKGNVRLLNMRLSEQILRMNQKVSEVANAHLMDAHTLAKKAEISAPRFVLDGWRNLTEDEYGQLAKSLELNQKDKKSPILFFIPQETRAVSVFDKEAEERATKAEKEAEELKAQMAELQKQMALLLSEGKQAKSSRKDPPKPEEEGGPKA